MKSIKNVLLVVLISVCSLLLVNVVSVKAAAGVGFINRNPVCIPNDNLKPGESTTCYVLGKGQTPVPTDGANEDKTGLTHGFVVRMYTTDGLIFDKVEPYMNDTNAVAFKATAESDNTQNSFKAGTKDISFTCKYKGDVAAEKSSYQIEPGDEYRCAIYYSNSEEPKITITLGKPTDEIIALAGNDSGLMVIGKVLAHIDDTKKNESSCGELCVYAKEITTTEGYGSGLEGEEKYLCTEVHFTDDSGPAPGPDTGAFASYALLAAGALVAIGAVTLAKRNNKFYKI